MRGHLSNYGFILLMIAIVALIFVLSYFGIV